MSTSVLPNTTFIISSADSGKPAAAPMAGLIHLLEANLLRCKKVEENGSERLKKQKVHIGKSVLTKSEKIIVLARIQGLATWKATSGTQNSINRRVRDRAFTPANKAPPSAAGRRCHIQNSQSTITQPAKKLIKKTAHQLDQTTTFLSPLHMLLKDRRLEQEQKIEEILSSPDAMYNEDGEKREYFSAELMLKSLVGTC
ncbi:hypothetical protein GQ43DRAFT_434218 [Delitschia confertaspora ATCC 74209]|uniref:Uncharacterized protein n=1 Tax=Delitschia confertaspora ATCC 74209 TaxID=1513339 RepID=A0A9P4JFI4_9PLEO|nr:hypothetical protein GQ43DRAFT_434218 [Delitschia confertaspora ATCC 74209]